MAQLRRQDCAAPLWPPSLDQADLRVAAVASDEGWGVYCLGGWKGADGLRGDAALHSNVEEHTVLHIFLGDFFPAIKEGVKIIRWEVDIMTALAYVRKHGGTCSLPLLHAAVDVHLLADSLGISILRLLPVVGVRRLPLSLDLVVDLQTNLPPHNLLDLHLVVWPRRHGGQHLQAPHHRMA